MFFSDVSLSAFGLRERHGGGGGVCRKVGCSRKPASSVLLSFLHELISLSLYSVRVRKGPEVILFTSSFGDGQSETQRGKLLAQVLAARERQNWAKLQTLTSSPELHPQSTQSLFLYSAEESLNVRKYNCNHSSNLTNVSKYFFRECLFLVATPSLPPPLSVPPSHRLTS